MASWDEVCGHLRTRWKVERDEPAAFAIRCPVQVGALDMVLPIGLAPTEVHGRPWLSLVSDLVAEAGLSARGALLYADRLPFGSIVLRNDRYLLRHGVAFDALRLIDLDWTLKAFAHEAVRLRANLTGPAPALANDAFGNYAE